MSRNTMPVMRMFIGWVLAACAVCAGAAERPNVVLIVADDLGWADLGCYGNRFNETPHIDRLARDGVRFTQFYAAGAVCSPTRASIQSGQYPTRYGLTAHIPGHWKPFERLVEPPCALSLPGELATLPEVLKEAGYATAHFGKWHLGGKGSTPLDHGFDESFDFVGQTVPRARQGPGATRPVRTADYLADRAIAFMRKSAGRPFFLQVSHSAVHIPLDTTPELKSKYEAKPKVDAYSCHPLYAGLLEEMDASVGRVLAELENSGMAANTVVIFVSDNGGLEREIGGWPGTWNRPLRDEKGTLYEGGIRIPMIVRWPQAVKAGGACESPAVTVDLYPTILELAALTAKPSHTLDGVSLAPVLGNPQAPLPRDAIYWHYPHYHHSRPAGAIRVGDLKAIEFFDTGAVEFHDLKNDIGESRDLAKEMPEKAAELRSKLAAWRLRVNAQMPQANPAFDPKRKDEWWSRAKVAPTEPPGFYKPGP